MGEFTTLMARDGHEFNAWLAAPSGPARGAVVIAQEIFGVNRHIRAVADGFAAAGYVTIAPCLFDRIRRGIELGYSEKETQEGRGYRLQIPKEKTLLDLNCVASTWSNMPAAWRWSDIAGAAPSPISRPASCRWPARCRTTAARSRITSTKSPRRPVMYHFGEKDPYIPPADVEKIRAADPNGVFHLYPGRSRLQLRRARQLRRRPARSSRASARCAFLAAQDGEEMIKLNDPILWKERGFIAGAVGGRRFRAKLPRSAIPPMASCSARVPHMGAAETRRAIEAAHAAMPAWAKKTAGERAKIMRKWFDLMIANLDDLAVIMTAEQGKPLAESKGEIAYAASFIEWFAEEGKRIYGDIIPGHQADKRIMVLRQPIGVVAAITPWNFPAAMITRKAAPAHRRRLPDRREARAADAVLGAGHGRARAARRHSRRRVQRGHRRCGRHRRRVHRQRQGAQAVVHRLDAPWANYSWRSARAR